MVSRLQAPRDPDARRRGAVNPAGPSGAQQAEVLRHGNSGTASAGREMARPHNRCNCHLLKATKCPQKVWKEARHKWQRTTATNTRSRHGESAVTNARFTARHAHWPALSSPDRGRSAT